MTQTPSNNNGKDSRPRGLPKKKWDWKELPVQVVIVGGIAVGGALTMRLLPKGILFEGDIILLFAALLIATMLGHPLYRLYLWLPLPVLTKLLVVRIGLGLLLAIPMVYLLGRDADKTWPNFPLLAALLALLVVLRFAEGKIKKWERSWLG